MKSIKNLCIIGGTKGNMEKNIQGIKEEKIKEKNKNLETDKKKKSTPYDDVFRTMINDCPRFLLPLLNDIFKTEYNGNEKIITANDYHFPKIQDGNEKKIITDSSFKVIKGQTEKKYHFECQSTIDKTMIIRIVEYDVQIALEDAVINRDTSAINKDKAVNKSKLIIKFPYSAVLYLRSNKNTEDKMEVIIQTDQGELTHNIRVIKMQTYKIQEIWEKELYFLIPFYIFTHEANFKKYEKDEKMLQELMQEYYEIRRHLEKLAEEEKISELEKLTIIELSKKVVDNIAANYKKITEGVEDIMGGKVIETEAKKIFNSGMERGLEQGLERGIEQGLERGIEQGLEQGIVEGKIETLYAECKMSVPDIAKKVSKPEKYVKEVIKKISAACL